MSNDKSIQVYDSKKGLSYSTGSRNIELSQEATARICGELVTLATSFIAETGKITVETFRTQANIYYAQLNAYVNNQTLKSEERQIILNKLDKITDKFMNLIEQANTKEEKKELMNVYKEISSVHTKLYTDALEIDSNSPIPKAPNFFGLLKNAFKNK